MPRKTLSQTVYGLTRMDDRWGPEIDIVPSRHREHFHINLRLQCLPIMVVGRCRWTHPVAPPSVETIGAERLIVNMPNIFITGDETAQTARWRGLCLDGDPR